MCFDSQDASGNFPMSFGRWNAFVSDPLPFFNQVLNEVPVAIYMCDELGYIKQFNKAAVELWGSTPVIDNDKWFGSRKVYNPNGTLIHLDQWPMVFTIRPEQLVSNHEVIVEHPDGQRFNILSRCTPLKSTDGKFIGTVNVLLNITSPRSEKDKQYRELADTLPQLIWISDVKGIKIFFNQSVFNYSGISSDQFYEESWLELIHPDDKIRSESKWHESLLSGKDFVSQERYRMRNGNYYWHQVHADPQHANTGEIESWVGIC